jgi:hypothetical protein
LIENVVCTASGTDNAEPAWPWDGEPIVGGSLSQMVGTYTVTADFLPMSEPLTTFETFNHEVEVIGDKVYLLSDYVLREYGFDGTANKISVTNLSAGNESIYVRLDYNYETDEFNTSETFPHIVQPTVTYYFDEAMSRPCKTLDKTGYYQIMQIPYSENPNNIYVSLAGAPYCADDMTGKPTAERYHANTATQIGFLTITVGVSEESLLPSPSQTFSWHDEEEDPGLIEPTVTEETTSAEETTTTETTSTEETTTAETTSAEETTTQEPILTE